MMHQDAASQNPVTPGARLTVVQGFSTHRPLSSSFLGLPYRILNMNHKKELLRRLWVGLYEAFHRFAELDALLAMGLVQEVNQDK